MNCKKCKNNLVHTAWLDGNKQYDDEECMCECHLPQNNFQKEEEFIDKPDWVVWKKDTGLIGEWLHAGFSKIYIETALKPEEKKGLIDFILRVREDERKKCSQPEKCKHSFSVNNGKCVNGCGMRFGDYIPQPSKECNCEFPIEFCDTRICMNCHKNIKSSTSQPSKECGKKHYFKDGSRFCECGQAVRILNLEKKLTITAPPEKQEIKIEMEYPEKKEEIKFTDAVVNGKHIKLKNPWKVKVGGEPEKKEEWESQLYILLGKQFGWREKEVDYPIRDFIRTLLSQKEKELKEKIEEFIKEHDQDGFSSEDILNFLKEV